MDEGGELREVNLSGRLSKVQKTFPKGILKGNDRGASTSKRTPVIYREKGHTIRIVPNKNPSVAIRRSRKHIHGTKKLRVVAYSPATKADRLKSIKDEASKLSKEELADRLGGRVKKNTAAPVELLRKTYIDMKESGLA